MKLRKFCLSIFLCVASMPLLAWDDEDFKSLYIELIKFKDSEEFSRLGFAPASPQHNWLERVEALREDEESDRQFYFSHSIWAGDLLTLGLEYVPSKGAETDYSREIREKMDAAFGL